MTKQRVFSGVQPSGKLHIGNYLGAIKNWVKSQNEFDNIFCVVDLHAITVPQDPEVLKSKIREVAALYITAGIDPKKSTIFVQSHIGAHAELAWILNCFIPMGWMQRMTQFKEKSQKLKESASVGLFDYPALMAADILLYGTEKVPVGEDQVQHVELARDIAKRFNSIYGNTFKIPETVVSGVGARIMALDDPTRKMSKSEDNPGHAVYLLDSPNEIRSKIARATTDSLKEIKFDKNRPGIYNLLVVYELFSGFSREKIEKNFEDKGYAEFKKDLAEVVIGGLENLQKNYKKIQEKPEYLDKILEDGAKKVRPIAEKTLKLVKDKIGLG